MRSVFHQKTEVWDAARRGAALRRIELRGKTDVVAGLIRFLHYSYETKAVVKTLEHITGAKPGPDGWIGCCGRKPILTSPSSRA